jgi:hypothetical protein
LMFVVFVHLFSLASWLQYLPNLMAALTVILWIHNFVSLVNCVPKCLFIMPFSLSYVCNLSYESLL